MGFALFASIFENSVPTPRRHHGDETSRRFSRTTGRTDLPWVIHKQLTEEMVLNL